LPMLQFRLLVVLLLVSCGLFAQEKKKLIDYTISLGTYFSSGRDLPFWMSANQNGVFSMQNGNYQLIQAGISKTFVPDSVSNWSTSWGANLVYGYGGKSDFQANQYWFGLRHKRFIIKAGAMHAHSPEYHCQQTNLYHSSFGKSGFLFLQNMRKNFLPVIHL
jgi:hypothetical protein